METSKNRGIPSLWLGLIGFLSVGLLTFIAFQPFVEVYKLTNNPTEVVAAPIYTGFLSNFGVLVWCASASVLLFCAILLKRMSGQREATFMLCFGLFSALLFLDDMFLVHETFLPNAFHIPEKLTIAVYGVLLLAILGTFYRLLIRYSYGWLILSFFFFGVSVVLNIGLVDFAHHFLIMGGSKFLGIICWFIFSLDTGLRFLSDRELGKKETP